jgi:hypothetical protein
LSTGVGVSITNTSGLTTGSLLRISTGTGGQLNTNGVVSITGSGAFDSISNTGLVNIVANSTTSGTLQNMTANALGSGVGMYISSTSTTLTTGSLLRTSSGTTGAVSNGIVNLIATGAYTSTGNAGLLTLTANGTLTGTIQSIFGNSLTTGTALHVSSSSSAYTGNLQTITLTGNNALNTGDLLELSITGASSAARGLFINNVGTGDSLRIDDVASDASPFRIDASGNVVMGGTATITTLGGATATTLCINAGLVSSCTSSERYKTDIEDLSIGLSTVMQLRPVSYNWKAEYNNPEHDIGFIAEELAAIAPNLATYKDGQVEGVKYSLLTALLAKAIQEQQSQIDLLRITDIELLDTLNALDARVAGLEDRVTALEGAQSGSGAAVDLVNFMATNGTFSGNLNVNGKIYMGNENVGEAKILAGDTEVTIAFDTDFETMPIIQVTPQSDNFLTLPVKYVVSEKALDKFKIKIDVAQLEDLVFNWSVTGTRDGVQIDSDGNVASL